MSLKISDNLSVAAQGENLVIEQAYSWNGRSYDVVIGKEGSSLAKFASKDGISKTVQEILGALPKESEHPLKLVSDGNGSDERVSELMAQLFKLLSEKEAVVPPLPLAAVSESQLAQPPGSIPERSTVAALSPRSPVASPRLRVVSRFTATAAIDPYGFQFGNEVQYYGKYWELLRPGMMEMLNRRKAEKEFPFEEECDVATFIEHPSQLSDEQRERVRKGILEYAESGEGDAKDYLEEAAGIVREITRNVGGRQTLLDYFLTSLREVALQQPGANGPIVWEAKMKSEIFNRLGLAN